MKGRVEHLTFVGASVGLLLLGGFLEVALPLTPWSWWIARLVIPFAAYGSVTVLCRVYLRERPL